MCVTVENRIRQAIICFLLCAGTMALVAGYYFFYANSMHWFSIQNPASIEINDVKIRVGSNDLYVGTVWPNYTYRYAFESPGEGEIEFEGKIQNKKVYCRAGYVSPHSRTDSIVEVLSAQRVIIYFGTTFGASKESKINCSIDGQ